jgi:hypothetical protein
MQSSTVEPIVVEPDDQATEAPAAPTLIMLEPAGDADVCAVDGWCA